MLNLVTVNPSIRPEEVQLSLDEIAIEGARRMLIAALNVEAAEYVTKLQGLLDEKGHRLVVRNGKAEPRRVTLGSGTVEVQAPRVRDRREGYGFTSKILPPYMRKSPKVENLLPILYLKGLSTGDFQSALVDLLGEGVTGLSPSSIVALKKGWEREFAEWKKRKIKDRYVYLFADGVHVSVRLGEDKRLCLLVLIGVAENGEKHLLACEPGYRESKDSWSAEVVPKMHLSLESKEGASMDVRVTDQEWHFLSQRLSHRPPRGRSARGRPRAKDRALFEGILWILVNGGRWRDLPIKQYPAKSSCHRRFAQWCRDGSWQKVQHSLIRMLGGRGKIDLAEGFIDGTQVKAKKGALKLGLPRVLASEGKRAV